MHIFSFGFKYGIPIDADFVADVRFLPNPFWVPRLRSLTGRDKEVSDYVLSSEGPRTSSTRMKRRFRLRLKDMRRKISIM